MARIVLPQPPTINNYYKYAHGRVYVSSEGQHFRQMVTAELLLQGIEQRMFSDTDRIEVVIDWRPPDRRVRDIDNPIKPLLDALEASSLVYKNDNQIDSLQITRPTLGRPVKVLDIFIG